MAGFPSGFFRRIDTDDIESALSRPFGECRGLVLCVLLVGTNATVDTDLHFPVTSPIISVLVCYFIYLLIALVMMVNEEMDQTSKSYMEELEAISDEIKDTGHRLERLYDAIETGKLELDDVVLRVKELRSK